MNPEEHLRQFIQMMHPLDADDLDALCSGWQEVSYKRKTILTAAGETERYLYYVADGIQRAFQVNEEGREGTLVFTYPPSFSGIADSLLTQTPSKFYFETLTASTFLRIPATRLFELMQSRPSIQAFVLQATAFALHGVLVRQAELQLMNAETRFRTLMKRSPHLLHLVPHKYIASYLGVDATNFSKMISSIVI